MKKWMKVAGLFLFTLPIAVLAEDYTYTTNSDNTITITSYTGSGGTVVITNTIEGLPVTGIRYDAFNNCTGLTSVAIPASVTNIADWAFYGCTSLTSITVDAANPVYSGLDGVLFNKNKTTLIQYPVNKAGNYLIPSSVTSIGVAAFSSCTGLTNVMIGNSVTSIGDYAFYSCSKLTNVTIPNSVTSIGGSAFSYCTGLTGITIPDSVTGIGDSAFYYSGLMEVCFEGNAPDFGSSLFSYDSNATVYYLPGTVGWGLMFGGRPTVQAQFNPVFTLNCNPVQGGTVNGGGTFPFGSTVTVTAKRNSNFRFLNWTENGEVVCESSSYTFMARCNRTLVANYLPCYEPSNQLFVVSYGLNTMQYADDGTLAMIGWGGADIKDLTYRFRAPGGAWQDEVIKEFNERPFNADYEPLLDPACLLFDSQNRAHVFIGSEYSIEHFIRTAAGSWELTETISHPEVTLYRAPLTIPLRMTVEKGPADSFHILLGAEVYGTDQSGSWQWELIGIDDSINIQNASLDFFYYSSSADPGVFRVPRATSLAVDGNGKAHITYCPLYSFESIPGRSSGGHVRDELWYASNVSGSWTSKQVRTFAPGYGSYGWGASIAVSPAGKIAIAGIGIPRVETGSTAPSAFLYYDVLQGDGSWSREVVANRSAGYVAGDGERGTGWAPYLRFDPNGNPHILFTDHASEHLYYEHCLSFGGNLRHADKTTGSWKTETLYAQSAPLSNQLQAPVLAVNGSNIACLGVASHAKRGSGPVYDFIIDDGDYIDYAMVFREKAYGDAASPHLLTVNGGTGDGSYTNGKQVTISATVPVGWKFASWNDGNTSTPRVITMPASPVTYTANFTDIQKPTVAFTAPTATLRILGTNPVYTVKGTATDNGVMTGVFCRVNGGAWTGALSTNGWKSWSVPLPLTAGSNLLQAFSADSAGNLSPTAGVSCAYVVTGSLRLQTNGIGTISRTPAGLPEVNQKYTLTATPAAGYGFKEWTGDVTGTNKIAPFKMTSNMTVTANFTDIQKPTVAITAPAAAQRVVTNGPVMAKGTATDNKAVAAVWIRLNSNDWTQASGTNSWTAVLDVVPGPNTIRAYSEDAMGNRSVTSAPVTFSYVVGGRLTLGTNGLGTITRSPATSPEVGVTYTLTATPAAGYGFKEWTGDVTGTNKIAPFKMTSNMTVTANFTDIQKPTVAITFPTVALRVSNAVCTVKGTATDNGVLTGVFCRVNSGVWTNAVTTNGWKSWSVPVTLSAGSNWVQAFSADSFGNISPTTGVTCTYVVKGALTIVTNGVGTVTRTPAGIPEVNQTYTLTATPGTGFGFANWTGDTVSNPTNKVATFVMSTNKMFTANFTDTAKPTVLITAPTLAQRILGTNGLFMVKGTALDNLALTNVLVQLNGGSWMDAGTTNGYKNWSLQVPLAEKTNTIKACSLDTTGNYSSTSTTTCVYVPTAVLTIQTNGLGAVSRTPIGAPEVGKTYTLTAAPAVGYGFTNWTGDVTTSTNKVITFVMTSNKTVVANFTDTQVPVVAITLPTPALRVTNAAYTVRGTASDNKALAQVKVQLNGGEWTNATGTNVWSLPVTLTAGTNTIRAYSEDTTGNHSVTSAPVVCTYVVYGILTITTNEVGMGTVTRSPIGTPEVGKTYTLTAAPALGYGFTNWTGSVTGTNKITTFVMTTNMMITANFTDTAKPTVTIATPVLNQRITDTNPVYMVSGTATDNKGVATVKVQFNSGDWTNAVTTNSWKNWSLSVTLVTGTNTVRAYSVDTTGNNSSTSSVVCTYPVVTIDVAAYANLSVGGRWNYKQTEGTDISTRALEVIEITVKNSNTVYLLQEYTDGDYKNDQFFWLADFSAGLFDTGGLNDNGEPTETTFYWQPFMPKLLKTFVPGTEFTVTCAKSDMPGVVIIGKGKAVMERVVVPAGTYDCWKVTGTGTANGVPFGTEVAWYAENVGLVKRLQDGSLWELTSYVPPAVPDALVDVLSEVQSILIADAASANSILDPAPTPQAAITVDGSAKDWANVPRSSFSYASVTQEVAVALDGNNIALLLSGCPFGASDNVLVYFKLRLSYGIGDNRHSVDLWTSGSVLYGMVDGQVIAGLEAVLLNGVLEVKLPVDQAPSQVTIEEIGCGMDLGTGTLTELFRLTPPPGSTP